MSDYPIDFGNGYKIQKVFANKTPDGGYGDIYDFRSGAVREHPDAEILSGYCVIAEASGLVPDGCNDWNESIAAAEQDYLDHVAPHLGPTFVLCMASTKEEYINSDPSEIYEFNNLEDCISECSELRNKTKASGYPDYFAAYVVAEDGSNPWRDIFVDLKATGECLWFPLNDDKCISVWYTPDKNYGDELNMKLELRGKNGSMGPHCELLCDERYTTGDLSYNSINKTLREIYEDAGFSCVPVAECCALTENIISAFGLKSPSLADKIHSATTRAGESQTPAKTPIFLFGQNRSSNRQGNYFDGEDPYKENWFEFYSIGEGGKICHEKQILMRTEQAFGTPDVVNEAIEQFFDEFRKKHPGHKIVVLGVESSDKPICGRVDAAIRKYERDHKVHKILPAYHEPVKQAESSR